MKTQEKFKQLLKTIFQYSKDKIDLDFGVYKVFKHNEKEIYEFVEDRLPSFLEEQFNKVNIEKNITIEDCYNDILNFFIKYYEGGDFYPAQYFSPHAKKHMLRHNGEEVIFSWANKDQYYIKNLSNFNDYTFKAPKKWFDGGLVEQSNTTVHFKMDIESIEELTGNKKDTRSYVLLDEKTELNSDGLIIYFGFKNGTAVTSEKLVEHLKEKKININTIDEIEHHLKKFINVRGSDFFIHKNLYKFLTEELDYYIKSELVDIDKPSTLNRARIVKLVAIYIIEFLSRLEELQRVLWEKKKFAYDVNYIITLDKIEKQLLLKIIDHPNFEKQKKEWIEDLKLINEFDTSKLYTDDLLKELSSEYKYLPLDTKHFEDDVLKYEILEEFENLDETIDGILINSDNFHGLNYLQKRFKEKVKCVYIDPPYNTGSDGFAYKDNYQHSSWLSMMSDRVLLAQRLLNSKGSFFSQIDYKEVDSLKKILNSLFLDDNFIQLISAKASSPAGIKTVNPGPIDVTEYIYFYTKERNNFEFTKVFIPSKYDTNYSLVITNIEEKPENWVLESLNNYIYKLHDIQIEQTYHKTNKNAEKKWGKFWKTIREQEKSLFAIENSNLVVSVRDPQKPAEKLKQLLIKSKGKDKVYTYSKDDKEISYVYNGGMLSFYSNKVKKIEEKLTSTEILTDFWSDISWDGIANEGKVKLKNGKKPERLINRILQVSNTLENEIILDYFAGSGTTPAVAHKMKKKYLAIEIGEYFDSLLLKRMKHTLFGESGGLKSQNQGGIIKYYSLEQYEDTLHNTSFTNNTLNKKLTTLDKYKETLPYLYKNKFISLAKDVSLSDSPSLLLHVEDEFLCDPFDYTLEIYKDNKYITTKIDLVETFNTLMGFEINTIKQKLFSLNNKRYLFINAKKEVIIWRKVSKDEINEKFIKEEEQFIQEHIDTNKKIYMNGINSYYTKAFLDGQANEILYAFRKILMDGIKDGD